MSDKGTKKNTTKSNKKASKNRKILTIKLDNGAEIPAKNAYMKDTKNILRLNDTDVDKIRISDKKLYSKEQDSYEYYVCVL